MGLWTRIERILILVWESHHARNFIHPVRTPLGGTSGVLFWPPMAWDQAFVDPIIPPQMAARCGRCGTPRPTSPNFPRPSTTLPNGKPRWKCCCWLPNATDRKCWRGSRS